jgi:hypothetical protein
MLKGGMRFQPAGRDYLKPVCHSRAARQADALESHTGKKEKTKMFDPERLGLSLN